MDAQFQSAPVGIGQIDASGTLTSLNEEFARLFGLRMSDAVHRPLHQLPPVLNDCWHEISSAMPARNGLNRWTVSVGAPPNLRSLEVVGWASLEADGVPVVQLLVSEIPPDLEDRSLTGATERARLAREIHDGLAQDLWLAKLAASKLARHPTLDAEARALCDELLRSIDSGLAEARTAVLAMRSDHEPTITLPELVERQVEEFSDRFGIRVDCRVSDVRPVPPRVAIEMLRILQEALNNVRKHANARRTIVRVDDRRASIVLSVRDDGIGFDPTIVESGYGRQSMHERAQSIGARLSVASAPGRGTTVTLRVPAAQLVSIP